MASRFVAICVLCSCCFVLHVPLVHAQVTEPTFGEMLASNVGDAIDAAQTARANMQLFNSDIAALRKSYRECGGTCAQRVQIAAEFDSYLMSKDYHYALMEFLGQGLAGLGADAHFDLTQLILGDADGGMPSYAAETFYFWTSCLQRGRQMGFFIDLPGPSAFQACEDNYMAHRERRNMWEFFGRPGVLEALMADNARGKGAPLFKEGRQTAESDLLPGDIQGQELLHCVYGPIGSEQDAAYLTFEFWHAKTPFTRVELLKNLQWASPWQTAPSFRIRYLRMPEISRTRCPPGDLNALAFYMGLTDSEEFIALVKERERIKVRLVLEGRQNIADAARARQEEEQEYIRTVNAGYQELQLAYRQESDACQQKFPNRSTPQYRECTKEASARLRFATTDLKNYTENSLAMRNSSNFIKNIAHAQGQIDGCQSTSDTTTRAITENLVRRAYPDSVSMLMAKYDQAYEERFTFTVDNKQEYGELPQCVEERMIERAKASPEYNFLLLRKDIHRLAAGGGRADEKTKNILTHEEIADWITIKTAYEAILKMKVNFFKGDVAARRLRNSNEASVWECNSKPPCAGIFLYVDDVRAPQLEDLHGIAVEEIRKIEYVIGREATGIYGEDHHQGAILVTTMRSNPQ